MRCIFLFSVQKAKDSIFYSYNKYINGFAAILDEDEAAMIAKHSNVVSVFESKFRKLHTTHSWDFLGLEKNGAIPHDSIWNKTKGEDIIIANLDTGVWPESKSFSDEGFGPIPKKWRGICQTDNQNPDKFQCNRKLIGTRYFSKGFEAGSQRKGDNITFNTPRDYHGHGSHTLSTAAGNFVAQASVFGNGNGTASGGAPKARVVAYKVCWGPRGSCNDADVLAAFEAAISDGVDVISMSLGGDTSEFFNNAISLGSFHAIVNGIIVVSSAGNSGPSPQTVLNVEPWMITVAASSIDREFANYIKLGDNKVLKGSSLSEFGSPSDKLYPLINAVDAKADNVSVRYALQCNDESLDPNKAKGKILVCNTNLTDAIDQGVEAARVGAFGMILTDDKSALNIIRPQPHVLPASRVNFTEGSYILNYINHTKSPVAQISRVKTELGIKPAPTVAIFSSRGPNVIEPAILKPDIIAPGVNIIAAYSEGVPPQKGTSDKRRTPFMTVSGTSMACPHVSGLVGLLKAFHPDWSAAAIKSAIMTTATINDNRGKPILDHSLDRATPFDYGAGLIQPNHAVDPGLVYDLDVTDYLDFLCGRGYNGSIIKLFYGKPYTCPESFNIADFNYPSISIPNLEHGHSQSVTRTLTNVGSPSKYRVHVNAPPEVIVSVKPKFLRFKEKGEKKEFRATFTLRTLNESKTDYFFGSINWVSHKHHVRSPIVVKHRHA
ncbi:PREDICTED: subtilisin-like protease SBT5.4 [Lupinus angustifolius]|uniref:subtilisin-like protease SBT5.4 n=1 Tax=Lupinus angustifolius TaxID=3871 RepID=UPI00092F0FA3|nr:PREDICTED: subtilisin-like protease SBT5.4 [Lupinus angustifolius]